MSFDVQGGGSDLIFPHHEMGAAEGHLLTGTWPYARVYAHAGMVGLDGHKMSKSRGNLVLVSNLRRDGVEPAAVRLAVLGQHYRSDWEWMPKLLDEAIARLATWRAALAADDGGPTDERLLAALRERLADDLDAPGALAAVDAWAATQLAATADPAADPAGSTAGAGGAERSPSERLAALAIRTLLGIDV
jgi:L-cysteine:1D-myo-inositol 2-amino-2-deoxy-alpha-D-glucopyranoside ligase